jgi:hypothetical protein
MNIASAPCFVGIVDPSALIGDVLRNAFAE